jgi:cystathionine gamma-lyase
MRNATRVIKAGLPTPKQGDPFLPGPTFASAFHAAGDPAASPYTYGRYDNPSWARLESALGELEEAEVIVFSSGMAAISSVLGSILETGDVLLMPSDCYYNTRQVAQQVLPERKIELHLAPTPKMLEAEALEKAKLIWLETPSNPQLDVCDIRSVVSAARRSGAKVLVDNTTATCLGQHPLELGADLSVASGTKMLTGHADLLLGYAATRDSEIAAKIRKWRSLHGAILGPWEAWLAHRSLGTAYLRLERQCSNALEVAGALLRQPRVRNLRYPGLPTDPGYKIAAGQMDYFGPVISFELPDRKSAERFLSSCQLIYEATSFGGIHTTAERRARWGGDQIAEGFIRLSVGCEDIADLIEDVNQALQNVSA